MVCISVPSTVLRAEVSTGHELGAKEALHQAKTPQDHDLLARGAFKTKHAFL